MSRMKVKDVVTKYKKPNKEIEEDEGDEEDSDDEKVEEDGNNDNEMKGEEDEEDNEEDDEDDEKVEEEKETTKKSNRKKKRRRIRKKLGEQTESDRPYLFYLLQYWIPPSVGDSKQCWKPSGKYYCGITVDFCRRLREHNRDVGVCGVSSSTNHIVFRQDNKNDPIWCPPLKGSSKGAVRTSKVLRNFPGGIWMPVLFVKGFQKQKTRIEYFEHLNQRAKSKVTEMFADKYYDGSKRPNKNHITATKLGTDRTIFHVLKLLALPKWSKKQQTQYPLPDGYKLYVRFASPRFVPKNQELLKEMLTPHAEWVDVDKCLEPLDEEDSATWLSPKLLCPSSFF